MRKIKKYQLGRTITLANGSPLSTSTLAKVNDYYKKLTGIYLPSLLDQLTALGISSITGLLSDSITSNIFGDSEVGRNVGNIFSLGVSSFGNTLANNVLKGNALFQGAGLNVGASAGGAAIGMASNYIGKGINSLGGDSMLSRGIGQGIATGLGSVGGTALQGALTGVKTASGTLTGTAGAAKALSNINPYALGMNVLGTGLSAAFGPSKEYEGKYGGITRGMDTAYDLVQAGVGFVPGYGQVIAGAMALNKGLSNIFGSTSGMTRQDAILGSAFMPAPVKWLNMAGAKTTSDFNNLTSRTIQDTNAFMLNAFGNLGEKFNKAREEANKTYGTFSRHAYKRALSNIDFANTAFSKILDMTRLNELQNIRSLYMSSINNQRYAQMIQGGWSPTAFGKQGMKILNNATGHNIGMRLLSGAALIDDKQILLSRCRDLD